MHIYFIRNFVYSIFLNIKHYKNFIDINTLNNIQNQYANFSFDEEYLYIYFNPNSNYNDINGQYFHFDTNESQITTLDKTKEEIKENIFDKLKQKYQFVNRNKRSSNGSVVYVFKKANKIKMKEENENKKKMNSSFWLKQLKLKY